MNLLWVFGVAVVAVCGFLFLRYRSPEFAPLLPLMGAVLLISVLMPSLEKILAVILDLGEQSGLGNDAISLILRGVGIGLVTRIASGVCYDCGQRTLGETVEYCGQIAVVSLAVPMISSLAQKITEIKF